MKALAASCRAPGPGVTTYKSGYAAAYEPALANALDALAKPDCSEVHRWVVRRRRGDELYPYGRAIQVVPEDLRLLARHMAEWAPIDRWQSAPAAVRRAYSKRVAELARVLAVALDEDVRPGLPNPWDLFDAPIVEAALMADPTYAALRPVRVDKGGSIIECDGRIYPEWPRLLRRQQLTSMLARLAVQVEASQHEQKRDARPRTGDPNHRVLARHLAAWFEQSYDEVPNGMVAVLVNVMLPSRDSPATTEPRSKPE